MVQQSGGTIIFWISGSHSRGDGEDGDDDGDELLDEQFMTHFYNLFFIAMDKILLLLLQILLDE